MVRMKQRTVGYSNGECLSDFNAPMMQCTTYVSLQNQVQTNLKEESCCLLLAERNKETFTIRATILTM